MNTKKMAIKIPNFSKDYTFIDIPGITSSELAKKHF